MNFILCENSMCDQCQHLGSEDSDEDDIPRMCLAARDRTIAEAFRVGGGDSEEKN